MSWNVVDSSAWLEYLTDGPNASFFAAAIRDEKNLLVPAVCFYEVCKVTRMRHGEQKAEETVAVMRQGQSVPMVPELALAASAISISHGLAMADSMIAATAKAFDAILWTQDEDFKDWPNVRYKSKAK